MVLAKEPNNANQKNHVIDEDPSITSYKMVSFSCCRELLINKVLLLLSDHNNPSKSVMN